MKHRNWSTWLRLVAIAAVIALIGAACGGDDTDTTEAGSDGGSDSTEAAGGGEMSLLEELQESGTVTVGIANEVPYGYEDENTGEVTGEAPETARRVFEELGIDNMEAVVTEFGGLIGGLQAGNFDMIAAGMYINADRAEQILFSDPSYCVLESMAVPEGNPQGLTNYNSVADSDAVLAVAAGTVNVDYATWAGIPDDQIELFQGIADQYDALAAGRVDAVSGTVLTVQQQVANMDGFEALPAFPALDEDGNPILGCGGFGFLDQELRDAFNDALNKLQDEGVIQEIVAEQFQAEGLGEEAADLTVEDLTGG
jgi:polar amino acid transport system substrate-binding protein